MLLEIMIFRKPKRRRYRIAMGPRALTASSGLAPWSMAVDLGSVKEKSNRSWGQGGLPPWAASPTGGERGHPRNFYAISKN